LIKGARGISENPAKKTVNSPPDKGEREGVGKFLLIIKNSVENPAKNPSAQFGLPLLLGEGGGEVENPAKNLDYGNKISVQGKIVLPTSFTADFDYRKYLRRFGVQTIIKNPAKFFVLEAKQGNWFLEKAKISRNWLEKNLEKSLPNPHAKIAMGVLLGVKNQLPKWTQTDFQNSGLMHLLVVSGTNVAIVIIAIGFLLRKYGRRLSFAGSLLALIFFVLMTGADAPILRAALMGGVAGLAIAWGKMNDARNLVLLSAVIIGLFQPLVVQNDLGFTLSFGATLGIIIGFPVLEKIFSTFAQIFAGIWATVDRRGIFNSSSAQSKPPLLLGEGGGEVVFKKTIKTIFQILAISLAAQITILPILIKSFGYFPLGGIPANLFSEPLIPFIMFFSFISSLLGFLPLIPAKIIAIPAYILIDILLKIAHFFAQIPVLEIPNWLNTIFTLIILSGLSYGLFSRDFEERFLVLENT